MHVERAGDVAAAQARARLGRGAAEPLRRAGVHDLLAAQLHHRRDLRHVAHQACVAVRGEVAVARDGRDVLQRAALGAPFRQAAVEHGHVGMAEHPEHPPHPRGGEQPRAVIDHHAMPVADPHPPHPADEFLDRRQHVRQRRLGVGDLVDVEELRAGDVRPGIFRLRVAACVGHVPRGVEHPHVGRAQMIGQPAGGDQKLRVFAVHGVSPRVADVHQ